MWICELLAPAGDLEALEAALSAGADAVYFGLDEGFNARARATNISIDQLKSTVTTIHRAGARAYLALNILVFEEELPALEPLVRRVAEAGIDALIVQDPGLALLAKAVCPDLELHASTQMTISSPEAAPFAQSLGITRIVVPRELSVQEIALFRAGTDIELEVFIYGALCVSWSGQCLSSEAWGGRSANRGHCAQACRLPYSLVVDGEVRPLGSTEYLLSPRDLAGFQAVSELTRLKVHTLKIEGRQKSAQYVYHAVKNLREWLDLTPAERSEPAHLSNVSRDLSLVYSRGLSEGFLAGSDHQTLVEGLTPRHRGLLLGQVRDLEGSNVFIEEKRGAESPLKGLDFEPKPGMGVVFRQGEAQESEQGGPIFKVARTRQGWSLGFGQPGPDLRKVRKGAEVYVTSDPALQIKKFPPPLNRIPLKLRCSGGVGSPLRVAVQGPHLATTQESEISLQVAQNRALTRDILEEQLGALGGTPFRLEELSWPNSEEVFLPLKSLRELRRSLVAELELQLGQVRHRKLSDGPQLPKLRPFVPTPSSHGESNLVTLCRTQEQLEAAIACGVGEVELDWMELVGLNAAVSRARAAGLKVGLATVRVQKPGEEVYDKRLEKLNPDSVLLRHWAGLVYFSKLDRRPILHGDFSLNVTNSITAHHLLKLGLSTVTASHDLDSKQLLNLLDQVDPKRVAVTIHHHIPTFHTEHCVYSHLLSNGKDYRTCGRPCERHQVALKDRVGLEHPVIVDVGCRNTVFNAQAQSGAFLARSLQERGVRRFRVELVRESQEESRTVLEAYRELLNGRLSSDDLVERLETLEQFGVTRGTMDVITVSSSA